jgi:hypothetical protein
MKRILFNLMLAISIWFGSSCIANAQAPVAQSDQIAEDQQIIQDDSSTTGKFEPVTIDPGGTSDVKLQFPMSFANKSVVVQQLDGGALNINGNSATIDQTGLLIFSFQVTDQPGVYRVIVIDPNADVDSPKIVGMVQFEVPNPVE